ncbi:MAG: hypothetical protein L0G72_13780, partial [Brevibacterium aurantiacum]|nr:hypothetical protein [Brevibacterium aurantiacum]
KEASMTSESPEARSARATRKDDHVRLASEQQSEALRHTDFDDLEFVHHALGGMNPERVDLSVSASASGIGRCPSTSTA